MSFIDLLRCPRTGRKHRWSREHFRERSGTEDGREVCRYERFCLDCGERENRVQSYKRENLATKRFPRNWDKGAVALRRRGGRRCLD